MSTNFYWKEIQPWFKKNAIIDDWDDCGNIVMHIGKRSAAGGYCFKCGITATIEGSYAVHFDDSHYDTCPMCGEVFHETNISFTWTAMIHKQLIAQYLSSPQKIIIDEYDREYTAKEFMEAIHTDLVFQVACNFS